jgi:flagellar biosynthesis protein FlhG
MPLRVESFAMRTSLDSNHQIETHAPARVFAVTSGKGGVGKTNVVANLAAALTMEGTRVTVVDGDLGLANLDLLLDVNPQYTLADFFAGRRSLSDISVTSPLGITLLPAANGSPYMTVLSSEQKISFLSELDALPQDASVMLVDTASGISDLVTYFASAAHEIVLVITPEPTSLTDAYALVKILASVHREKRFWVLANTVEDEAEARRLFGALARTAQRFLPVSFDLLGWIPRDPALTRAVTQRRMVMETAPHSPSARAFTALARRLADSAAETAQVKGGLQFFFRGVLAASLEERR